MFFDLILENQFNNFLKYSIEHSIDMHILNTMDDDLINDIANESEFIVSATGNKYASIKMTKHIYLLKFADNEACSKVFKDNILFNTTCKYEEPGAIINNQLLKYIIVYKKQNYYVYTFDSKSCNVLMRVDTDGDVLITKDFAPKVKLDTYNDNFIWSCVQTDLLPDDVKSLICTQKIMLTMLGKM